MHLPVTLTTAGLLGLVYFMLSLRVVQVRTKLKVSLGHAGDELLLSRIRAHANFAEYVPLVLILLGAIELAVVSPWLWLIGLGLVVVRIAHAVGMALPAPNPFRIAGTAGTFVLMLAASIWAIAVAFS